MNLARWAAGGSCYEEFGWAAYFMAWANEEIDRELAPEEQWGYGAKTYVVQCQSTLAVKIGTSVNPDGRLGVLQVGSPTDLRLIAILNVDERYAHDDLRPYRMRGEWFEWTPEVEAYIAKHRRAA